MYAPMQPQMSTPFHHQGYGPFGGMPPFEYPFGFRQPSMPVQIPTSMGGSASLDRTTKTPPSLDRISNQSPSPPPTTAAPGTKLPPKETKSRSPPPEKPRNTRPERNNASKYNDVSERTKAPEVADASDRYDRSERPERSDRSRPRDRDRDRDREMERPRPRSQEKQRRGMFSKLCFIAPYYSLY